MPTRNSQRAIVFVAIVVLLVIGCGTALLLDRMRQTAREAANGVVQRAASVVESTVNRLFLQIDGTLASLPGLVGQVAQSRDSDPEEVSRILRSINFQNLNFRDLLLVRPDGIAWASALASSRNRPLPISLQDTGPAVRSGTVSFVGPVQNPTTGEWALFVVRPVRLPNMGILYAAAEVPVPLIVTLLNPAAEVRGLRVAVTRTDGRLLVGLPHDEARLSRQLATNTGTGEVVASAPPIAEPPSQISAARPTLYRTIGIAVTLDTTVGGKEWERDRDRLIAVALGASLVVLALTLAALLVVQQRERTQRERERAQATLESAIDSMSDGFVMFDAEDRLVVCNQRYKDLYAISAPFIAPGATFEHIMREGARHGQYPEAGNDLEGFVRDMVAWHHGDHPPMERLLPDGRWLLITERPMPDGGTVGIRTDITAQKQAMRELAIGERRYSALAKAGAIVTWHASADGTILEAPGWADLTGLPDAALRDGRWLSVIHPEDHAAVLPNWAAAADADGSVDIEFRILTNSDWRWMRVRGAPVYEPQQSEPSEWVGTIHDVHDRRAAQAALAESEARFVRAISAVGMGTWDWTLATDVLHLSPGYETLYQKEEGSLPTGRAAADAMHPDDLAAVTAAVDQALEGTEGDSYDIEFRVVSSGGSIRWLRMQGRAERDTTGKAVRMSGVTQDVTAKHAAESQMAHMARHDALTDLPNRTMLRERMDAAMADAKRGNASAIFCLDLDRFKQVNDTLGHPIGDALLRAVSDRILGCIRKADMVARIGGDEFAIVQSSVNQPSEAKALAQRIVAEVSRPYEIEGSRIVIGTSLGIAVAPQDGIDSDRLLRSADLALYRAKTDGRGTYRFFEPEMNIRMQARHELETDLRRALVQQEFEVFYQPLIDIRTRQVCSFEALLRWRHPVRGLVAPDSFIPAAEELGLIGQIGEVVLARACADATHWPDSIKVAVNLSPAQFTDRGMMSMIMGSLHRSGLPPDRLELEITETLLLQESENVLAILHQLQAAGITISMDDFGTGYSSLSYLRKFSFRKVKIDKSFIRDLCSDAGNAAIVHAVLDLCRTLGIKTTAEGVETEDHLAWLDAAGCVEAQGFLFSAARPAAEIPLLLQMINGTPMAAVA